MKSNIHLSNTGHRRTVTPETAHRRTRTCTDAIVHTQHTLNSLSLTHRERAGRRRADPDERCHSGVALGQKNDLDLIERSRKVSHFSLQATHPESSSERVLTARRYPNFGRQRFESMGKVWVADRSGIHADRRR